MKLHIILNPSFDKDYFINHVYECLQNGEDSKESEIKNWDVRIFNNINKEKERGMCHCKTQFEENGWVTLEPDIQGIKGMFRKKKDCITSREQEAIILFRFASMLRNHFNDSINSITLTDL